MTLTYLLVVVLWALAIVYGLGMSRLVLAADAGSARMQSAVQQFIERVVGQDDLVAVMTPEMSVKDIALGRRTSVITGMLNTDNWGRRGRFTDNDPIEDAWEKCYVFEDPTIFPRMKARRREKMALDALDDLVVHLGGLRDERKAVLAVRRLFISSDTAP